MKISVSKLLSKEDEYDAIRRYQSGEKEAGQIIINAFLPTIERVATKFHYNIAREIEITDLVAEGIIGAYYAMKNFDISLGLRFSTLLRPHLDNHINNLRYDNRVKGFHGGGKGFRSLIMPGKKLLAKEFQKTGREMSMGEQVTFLMEKMKKSYSRDCVERLLAMDKSFIGFDTPATIDGDMTIGDMIEDDSVICEEDLLDQIDIKKFGEVLQDSIFYAPLTKRQRQVFELMLGECDMSLTTTAHKLGVSRENIRQLYEKAVLIIKKSLQEYDPVIYSAMSDERKAIANKRLFFKPKKEIA